MKKTLFAIIMTFAALLTACDSPSADPAETTLPSETTSPTLPSDPIKPTMPSATGINDSYYYDYEEYLQLEIDPSILYIPYEKIQFLGEFDSFIVKRKDDSLRTLYGLKNGDHVFFFNYSDLPCIDNYSAGTKDPIPATSEMRNFGHDVTNYGFVYHGIRYDFIWSDLKRIEWEIDGIYYSISSRVSPHLDNYPIIPGDLVSDLLNLDTADEAIARFRDMISTHSPPAEPGVPPEE